MVSYPYLVNNGFNLYSDFIHPYPPALTFILAFVFKHLSYELIILKVITWLLILANDVLIYLVVSKLTKNKFQALLAVLLYVITQPFLEGNMLWFDTALVTPVLAGLLFLINKTTVKNLLMAGLFFALAIFIKQTSALLLVVGIGYLLFKDKKIKNVVTFLIPSFVLGTVFLGYLLLTVQLQDFLNWTLIYPFTYWSKYPGYVRMGLTRYQFGVVELLLLPLVFLIVKNIKKLTIEAKLMLAQLLTSLIMIYPRFSFFHFQLSLALIVMLFAYLSNTIKYKYYLYALYLFIVLASVVRLGVGKYWGQEARFWSKSDIGLAQSIKEVSLDKKIYLLGLPSSFYVFVTDALPNVYANTLPPKPWTDNFGWYLEIPGVQENIITKWSRQPAEYVFWQQPQPGNWYDLGTYQPKQITDWIKTNYTKSGNLDQNTQIWKIKD